VHISLTKALRGLQLKKAFRTLIQSFLSILIVFLPHITLDQGSITYTLRNAALKLGEIREKLTYILTEKETYQHSYQIEKVVLQCPSQRSFKNKIAGLVKYLERKELMSTSYFKMYQQQGEVMDGQRDVQICDKIHIIKCHW
jgi:hypothetical protein